MKPYESLAIGRPDILLPKPGIDLTKWAVVACDQYTSEREYWQKVREYVGDAASTLNLIYPEAYLGEADADTRINRIRGHMKRYLDERIFEEYGGFIFVERETGSGIRQGFVACLDLEHYDFQRGARSLIRATEGTILSRIPPRVKIREGAPLELPHIMVLIDDPENSVIGPLSSRKDALRKLYDFDLMMNSGRLAGYQVVDPDIEKGMIAGLKSLADRGGFSKKYGLKATTPVLLFAMGDGNHSLATAKTIWEKTKEAAPDKSAVMASPLRYALVEIVNLHDPALVFEPIHRVLFDLVPGRNFVEEIIGFYRGGSRYLDCLNRDKMKAQVDGQKGIPQRIGVVTPRGHGLIEVSRPDSNLPVGTLQNFLDSFMAEKGAREIDYVHGAETVFRLGQKSGSAGFYLPAMEKRELFKTVILDGALPRKTFSMGEAWEKRFYMEARKLTAR